MEKFKDLTGMHIEMLTAVKPTDKRTRRGNVVWECKCDCGNTSLVESTSFIRGHTKSCGCLRSKNAKNNSVIARNNLEYINGTCVEKIVSAKIYKNNTSGHKGVSYYFGKWKSYIYFKGKQYILGTYEDIGDAINVRKIAEEKIFGEFLKWYENEYRKPQKSSIL